MSCPGCLGRERGRGRVPLRENDARKVGLRENGYVCDDLKDYTRSMAFRCEGEGVRTPPLGPCPRPWVENVSFPGCSVGGDRGWRGGRGGEKIYTEGVRGRREMREIKSYREKGEEGERKREGGGGRGRQKERQKERKAGTRRVRKLKEQVMAQDR